MSFTFLDELDNSSNKQKFQKYKISVGIESFGVLVPFENSSIFESKLTEAINDQTTKFKVATLQNILNEVSGKFKAK